jgi:hypothetical protein
MALGASLLLLFETSLPEGVEADQVEPGSSTL